MQSLLKAWNYKNIISKAKMGNKSVLVVEGIDDVKKFNSIKQSIEKTFEVKSIGTFENYYEQKGALPVIDFIENVISFNEQNNVPDYFDYILGIVDGDSICYKRKENKENNLLYVLDYYSLESYYINKEVIEKTLYEVVSNPDLINENLIDDVYNICLNNTVDRLYYISLEALKKSCQEGYTAIIGYKPDNIINFLDNVELENRKESLETFAQENNYNKNMALQIIKGKWFISTFCAIYFDKIKELTTKCHDGNILKCDNCIITEITEPCLYKPKDSKLNKHSLEEKFYSLTNLTSLTPIKERLKQLN